VRSGAARIPVLPLPADTRGRGEEVIVISDNFPIYNWGQSAVASTEVQTKTVKLGQTIEQIDQILGAPQKILH